MPNLSPQKYLSGLNSERAFLLFVSALFTGCVLLFGGWGKPFVPVLPIIAYGLALIVSQEFYFVLLGPNIRDSPYFLGFILTLLEILNVFIIGLPQNNVGGFLYREIGTAILTTTAGLIMRQRLLANDTAEEAQERIFRTIAEEVRKDTVEFHRTQKLFVGLIREFVQTRETMFSQEEKASERYLKALEDAALKLGKLPQGVDTVIAALETSADRVAKASSTLGSGLQRLNDECASLAKAIGTTATTRANGYSSTPGQASSAALPEAEDLVSILGRYTATLGQASSAAAGSAASFQQAISKFSSSYGNAKKEIEAIVQDLRRVGGDISAIDQITNDLIRILRDRISAVGDIAFSHRAGPI